MIENINNVIIGNLSINSKALVTGMLDILIITETKIG